MTEVRTLRRWMVAVSTLGVLAILLLSALR